MLHCVGGTSMPHEEADDGWPLLLPGRVRLVRTPSMMLAEDCDERTALDDLGLRDGDCVASSSRYAPPVDAIRGLTRLSSGS